MATAPEQDGCMQRSFEKGIIEFRNGYSWRKHNSRIRVRLQRFQGGRCHWRSEQLHIGNRCGCSRCHSPLSSPPTPFSQAFLLCIFCVPPYLPGATHASPSHLTTCFPFLRSYPCLVIKMVTKWEKMTYKLHSDFTQSKTNHGVVKICPFYVATTNNSNFIWRVKKAENNVYLLIKGLFKIFFPMPSNFDTSGGLVKTDFFPQPRVSDSLGWG